MRIAIVNDSVMAVETLRRAIQSSPDHQVAWVAYNGEQAVANCAQDKPDLILMDLIMPGIDGVETTRRIMAATPCPILLVTATIKDNSAKVFEALGAGALDAISTPVALSNGANSPLLYKIGLLGQLAGETRAPAPPIIEPIRSTPRGQMIALGASAGGPAALAKVLEGLPKELPTAVIVVQHLDAQFAPGLASWLSDHSAMPVRLAQEGDYPQAGTVLVAGSNDHLILRANGSLGYTPDPVETSYRPSIDEFFLSVERRWKGKVAAALLTGMGRDGAKGLKSLRDSGAFTIAQSREGCVVYGMPKAAAELDAAAEILPLDQIASALAGYFVAPRVK